MNLQCDEAGTKAEAEAGGGFARVSAASRDLELDKSL